MRPSPVLAVLAMLVMAAVPAHAAGFPSSPPHLLSDMQEGTAIVGVNSSSNAIPRVSEWVMVPVISNLTPGYFLSMNAWTSITGSYGGDWFQMGLALSFNCGLGGVFQGAWEVWNNAKASVAISNGASCPSFIAATGNRVLLSLNATSASHVCMTWVDANTSASLVECFPQPDPGVSAFSLGFDGGYLTGAMTELIVFAQTPCVRFSTLTEVGYSSPWLTRYIPFGDEQNSTGAPCYVNTGNATSVSDRVQVFRALNGSYGPHWVGVNGTNITTDYPFNGTLSTTLGTTTSFFVPTPPEVEILAVTVAAAATVIAGAAILFAPKGRKRR